MKAQTAAEILAPYRAMMRKRQRRTRTPWRPEPWWERRLAYLSSGGREAYPGEIDELRALRGEERKAER